MKKKVIITGGGTGGHVFPALALADEISKRGFQILYVGTERGMESKLVPEKGYPFFTVKTGSIKNQGPFKILHTLWQLVFGVVWAIKFVFKEKPGAIIGVGGYVSFPICFAAFLLRKNLYLQEQNTSVGIANRILGRLAKRIFLGFAHAIDYFDSQKCEVTGNPLRDVFYENVPFDPHKNSILIMGGSQGAHSINHAILSLREKILSAFPSVSIVHQTGKTDFEKIKEAYNKSGSEHWEVQPFIQDVIKSYAKASLVICRAGALTVSELIQVGRPAIFVPYPRVGQNDQVTNANFMKEVGAAYVVEQGPEFEERLWQAIQTAFKPDKLKEMHNASSKLRRTNSTATIADLIIYDARLDKL